MKDMWYFEIIWPHTGPRWFSVRHWKIWTFNRYSYSQWSVQYFEFFKAIRGYLKAKKWNNFQTTTEECHLNPQEKRSKQPPVKVVLRPNQLKRRLLKVPPKHRPNLPPPQNQVSADVLFIHNGPQFLCNMYFYFSLFILFSLFCSVHIHFWNRVLGVSKIFVLSLHIK